MKTKLLVVFCWLYIFTEAQPSTKPYYIANGGYANYTSDVNTSYYPVLQVNSEHSQGPKSVVSVGYGGNLLDMFTKISSWSRNGTNNNIDSVNYIAIGENGSSYTPGNFLISGNVGIGTINPIEKLSLNGNLKGLAENSFLSWDQSGMARLGFTKKYGSAPMLTYSGSIMVAQSSGGDISSGNDFTSRMYINSDGNVGIGTITPTAKLAVNGNVKAKEVNVTINASDWPDYVFHQDYKLPNLDSLSAQIKELGHLPGMPSTKEIKEKGLDLGEMNKKLLRKVEELTLYLMDVKQENRQLQKRMKQLEIKITNKYGLRR